MSSAGSAPPSPYSTRSWSPPPHEPRTPHPPLATAAVRVSRGLRERRRLHGHRPRRPDPPHARPRRGSDPEPGLAAVLLLLRDDRRVDARRRLGELTHRPAPDAAGRARARGPV